MSSETEKKRILSVSIATESFWIFCDGKNSSFINWLHQFWPRLITQHPWPAYLNTFREIDLIYYLRKSDFYMINKRHILVSIKLHAKDHFSEKCLYYLYTISGLVVRIEIKTVLSGATRHSCTQTKAVWRNVGFSIILPCAIIFWNLKIGVEKV